MPFNPHTPADVEAMLEAIGVGRIEDLFDEIPAALRGGPLQGVAGGMSEMDVGRLMRRRAAEDGEPLCFIGAGAYDHHIPAAVWAVATRGELYSAYTPYQAEASQGTLQIIYEFQSMVAGLTGLDVANASLYDGASALAEAILMAVRANRKAKAPRILLPSTIHPAYRAAADTIVRNQGIELVDVPYDPKLGRVDPEEFDALLGEGAAAVVIPQPNFFGCLEEVDALTDRAHARDALVIGLVNPVALALLKPPGQWGGAGADIACGEGQPLGAPLSSGGPYFGFMSCRQQHVRQMPGRIVGRTVDAEGRPGFTLTLQAREQHIRRSKATSNICTNQGLLAAAATVHMALLGPEGLERVALASHANTRALVDKLTAIDGVERVFDAPVFHEAVLRLDEPVEEILRALAAQDILGGYPLAGEYPELENTLLVCATETRGAEDIEAYAGQLERILSRRRTGPGCTRLRPPEGTI